MNSAVTKQKMIIKGKTLLGRSVMAFEKSKLVDDIIVVVRKDELEFAESELSGIKKLRKIVIGGNTRAESAKNAFLAIGNNCLFFGVHDCARCLIDTEDVDKVISDAFRYGAATASTPVYDTVKEINESQDIKFTHKRETMRFVQTPQVFDSELYRKALESISGLDPQSVTDDNMLLENIGVSVHCTDTKPTNIKITTAADIEYAEFLLKRKKKK